MQSFNMALKSISGNRMRSFLTMLGIIIGVLAIVVLVAIAQGSSSYVTSSIEGLGTNLFTVSVRARRNNPLTLKKLTDLSQEEGIAHVAPTLTSSGTLKAGVIQYDDGSMLATTPSYPDIRGWTLRSGRFIAQPDVDNRSFVAVVGQEAATEMFGTVNAVGQTFTFKGYSFTVVGVLDEIGSSLMGSGDNVVVIPFTLGERLFSSPGINSFYVSAVSAEEVSLAEEEIKAFMDKQFSSASSGGSSAYSVYNQTSMLATLQEATDTLTMMLAGIAAIALLVGGIGIMNIMLVSVSERTREIGIRKAIGATRSRILSQFLIEALVLSVIGGLIGLMLSAMILYVLEPILSMPLSISPQVALIAVGFSVLIGVVFGLYPANKASKLRPIEALRHE